MSYGGYVLKIGGVVVPNNIMVPGSFSVVTEKRIAHQWKDVLGKNHYQYYPGLKHKVTFSIKARTKAENDILKAYLVNRDNVSVEFWCDDSGVDAYVTCSCKLENPTFTHSYDNTDSVYYDTITLTYSEY